MSDAERPLNIQGVKACEIIGNTIKKHNIKPDIVLCSTAIRTRQTWELVSAEAENSSPVEYSKKLYLASAATMLSHIQALKDAALSVLIVTHNPGIHDCAAKLCKQGEKEAVLKIELSFPTGSLAIIECDARRWCDVVFGQGFLKGFITPKELGD